MTMQPYLAFMPLGRGDIRIDQPIYGCGHSETVVGRAIQDR